MVVCIWGALSINVTYPKNRQETDTAPPTFFKSGHFETVSVPSGYIFWSPPNRSLSKRPDKTFFNTQKVPAPVLPRKGGHSTVFYRNISGADIRDALVVGKKNATVFLDDIAVASQDRLCIVFRINNYVNLRVQKAFMITKISCHFPGVKTPKRVNYW